MGHRCHAIDRDEDDCLRQVCAACIDLPGTDRAGGTIARQQAVASAAGGNEAVQQIIVASVEHLIEPWNEGNDHIGPDPLRDADPKSGQR